MKQISSKRKPPAKRGARRKEAGSAAVPAQQARQSPAAAGGEPVKARAAFRSDKVLHGLMLVFVLFWLAMLIRPYSWYNWWLENALTIGTLLALAVSYRWFRFSRLSYALITLFLMLHTYGAHFSYNTTPLDTLMRSWFGFHRDNFDRVVHFAFGLLIAVPLREFGVRVMGWRRPWSYPLSSAVILAFGALYELIEMWVALIVSPEIGTRFLGTQGDIWDSQHDMEAALYGAVLTMTAAALWSRFAGRKPAHGKPGP